MGVMVAGKHRRHTVSYRLASMSPRNLVDAVAVAWHGMVWYDMTFTHAPTPTHTHAHTHTHTHTHLG